MTIVRQPLTVDEIKTMLEDNTTYITGVIPVDLAFAIANNFEGFLDELSEKLIGRATLMDINYKCVGVENDGLTLLIEVSGDVSELLDDEE